MSSPASPRSFWKRYRLLLTVPALLLIALVSWAVSSPVSSSPDDDYHQTSIWCALGDRPGLCESASDSDMKLVPRSLVESRCYARDPNQDAGCILESMGSGGSTLVETARGNFGENAGSYPPVYYAAMAPFASADMGNSVLLIRTVNALLFVLITSALYALLPRGRRQTAVLTLAATLIPLGVFLIGSINPSAWAILSAATLCFALIGYYETTGARKAGLGALAALSTLMGAGARSDSAIYCILAIVAVGILHAKKERQFWLSSILPLVLIVFSAFIFLSSGQSDAIAGTQTDRPGGISLLLNNLFEVPALWAGVFGTNSPISVWGLGWLDTPMPAVTWMSAIVVFGAVIFAGLKSTSGRKLLVVAGGFAVLVLMPLYMHQVGRLPIGTDVQPRYILPLIIIFTAFVLLRVTPGPLPVTRLQLTVGAVALAIANSAALFFNLRRYIFGANSPALNLNDGGSWWWGSPVPSPMTIWIVGSLTFAAALVLLARWTGDREASGLLPNSSPSAAPPEAESAEVEEAGSAAPPEAGSAVVGEAGSPQPEGKHRLPDTSVAAVEP
ncbi:DUF2142 domain-containing protein [Actinomycetaceae bacterium L2_0104]